MSLLSAKIKDMGLSEKAITELVELGIVGLKDDSSDEEITAKVDSIVPFAKAMQGEFTRKVQEAKQSQQSQKQSKKNEGEDGNGGEGKKGEEGGIPDWFRDYKAQNDAALAALKEENESLKAEGAKKEREAKISAKAKELGIPEFLMKRFSIAEDADYEQELLSYKQDLVNNKLMSADSAGEKGSSEQAIKDSAKSWAESLPNK